MMTTALGWFGLLALSMTPGAMTPAADSTISAPAVLGTATSEVAVVDPRRLVLQVHRLASIGDRQVEAMMGQVERIWSPYGFAVSWSDAPPAALSVSDVFLRVVIGDGGPPGDAARRALSTIGWIEFLGPGQPRDVVHVSIEAATRLMEAARLVGRPLPTLSVGLQTRFMVQALGRSLAHEIGHYLFATTSHTQSGLMREAFSPEELLDGELDEYRLEMPQVEALAERVCAGATGGDKG